MSAQPNLETLLDFLKRSRGFDFTGYKRSSLERRILKRMDEVGVADHGDYIDFLEIHQDEFNQLFNTILINVTAFFRDAAAWEALARDIVPQLLARDGAGTIRVWCAGCASGEEAFTVAIVLAEAIGEAGYRDRVKIYATDIDEEALNDARHAVYTAKQVEGVPSQLLDKYFERTDHRFAFRKDLRRTVIFGRNDLVQDAPISRIDLLVCRNTLMYFNAETQARILRRFHFALDDAGYLLLGKSEMLITHTDLFTPVDLKHRIFRRVLRPNLRDRLVVVAQPEEFNSGEHPALRESAFDASPAAQIAVDGDDVVMLANQRARQLFNLTPNDIGRPMQDLELSYRPLEVRSHLERVRNDGQGVAVPAVSWTDESGERFVLDVQVTPLYSGKHVSGASITYVDVTQSHRLQDELKSSKHDLEQAYEELQSTVEELETTNEELQSTNEELETTNEELQSTNEELETMNEELQSTNEELETMNDELRQRTLELNEVNAFTETILSTMGAAVAVLDRQLHVRVWNAEAQELWGLRADEVDGQHILGLDMGLPVEQLKTPLRLCLAGEKPDELRLAARDRRGRELTCLVRCLPLAIAGDEISGVIVLMERDQTAD